MAEYINSFYNERNPRSYKTISGSRYLETYKDFDLYKYSDNEFHIVKDGICIGMFAGLNGAKREIDNPMYIKIPQSSERL